MKQTRVVESAIRQAAALRFAKGRPINGADNQCDAGLAIHRKTYCGETAAMNRGIGSLVGSGTTERGA